MKITPATLVIALAFAAAGGYGLYRLGMNQGMQMSAEPPGGGTAAGPQKAGDVDPATGKTTEWASPSGPKSQPYAITFTNGIIWYVESATKPNALVRFDPRTEKLQTWKIPGGGGVVRNMMPTSDGNLVLAESGLNMVALVEVGK